MSEEQQIGARGEPVDLDAIQRLVDMLEEDLSNMRSGAGDVERLRAEVDALKNLLDSPAPHTHTVRDSLHNVRSALDREWDSAKSEAFTAGRYVAEIARILGI